MIKSLKSYSSDVYHYYLSLIVMLQAKLFGDSEFSHLSRTYQMFVITTYPWLSCYKPSSLVAMIKSLKSYSSDVCHYYLSLIVMLQAKLFGDSD